MEVRRAKERTMSTQTSPRRPGSDPGSRPRIAVGLEHADQGTGAVLWASGEATRHSDLLQVVTACPTLVGPAPGGAQAYVGGDTEATTRESMTRLTARLGTDAVTLPPKVAAGSPTAVLLDATGEGTRMLVVGRRGLKTLGRALLGSTSIALAGRSPVPVVVVPDDWSPAAHSSSPVVVGTTVGDDSDTAVLRFAFEQARGLRVPVVVVHAWEIPALYGWSPTDIADFRSRVAGALEEHLAPWREEFDDVEVVATTVAERASDAVLDASRVAQLAVVGRHTPASRHRGLRLGSTARAVLHRAETPVAVVPLSASHLEPSARPASDAWGPTI
jgi:nucleotide-binding universal stress UspA family protein